VRVADDAHDIAIDVVRVMDVEEVERVRVPFLGSGHRPLENALRALVASEPVAVLASSRRDWTLIAGQLEIPLARRGHVGRMPSRGV
jgi:hypothetical protein